MHFPDDVAVEIWEACFLYCNRPTLLNLSLTCQAFRDVTTPLRFKQIMLMSWLSSIPDFGPDWIIEHPGALDAKLQNAFKRIKFLATDSKISPLVRMVDITGAFCAGILDRTDPASSDFLRAYETVLFALYRYLPAFRLLRCITLNELDMTKDLLSTFSKLPALAEMTVQHSCQLDRLLSVPAFVQLPKLRITRLKVFLSTYNVSYIRVDGLFRFLELCQDLEELEVVDGPGFVLPDHVPTLSVAACPSLRVLSCPPELVQCVLPGRLIRRLEIQSEFEGLAYGFSDEPVAEALHAIHSNGSPIQELTITCLKLGSILNLVAELFPRLRTFTFLHPGTAAEEVSIHGGGKNIWEKLAEGKIRMPLALETLRLEMEWTSSTSSLPSDPLANQCDVQDHLLDVEVDQQQKTILAMLRGQYTLLRSVSMGRHGPHWHLKQGQWMKAEQIE